LWDAPHTSWDAVDTKQALAGQLDDEPPKFVARTDGVLLLYNEKVSDIHGEPESCKGWFACYAAADVMQRGYGVVYVDFEDSPKGLIRRMQIIGVSDEVLIDAFQYVGPSQPLTRNDTLDTWSSFHRTYLEASRSIGLVVLDGVTQAMANQAEGSSNSNDDIANFYRDMPRTIAKEWRCAVLLVDHITKDAGNARFAIGGQMKLAAVDGASFLAEVKQPFGRGREGLVTLKVAKDRPGYVREHGGGSDGFLQHIAEVRLVSDKVTGSVTMTLQPPLDADHLMLIRMRVVCDGLQAHPGMNLTDVRAMMPGCGNSDRDKVIDELERRGYIERQKGAKNATLHSVREPLDLQQAFFDEFPLRSTISSSPPAVSS
jgi:hypothetical protein